VCSINIIIIIAVCVCVCVCVVAEAQEVWRCAREKKRRACKHDLKKYEDSGADAEGHKLKDVYDKCLSTKSKLGIKDMSTEHRLQLAQQALKRNNLKPEVRTSRASIVINLIHLIIDRPADDDIHECLYTAGSQDDRRAPSDAEREGCERGTRAYKASGTRTYVDCVRYMHYHHTYRLLCACMQEPPTVKAESSNMHVTVESDALPAKSIQVNKPIQYSAYGITHALVSNFLRRPITQMVCMHACRVRALARSQ
jgi:hypothetical protein